MLGPPHFIVLKLRWLASVFHFAVPLNFLSFMKEYLTPHDGYESGSFPAVSCWYTPNSGKSLERAWSRGNVDRTKEYSFVLSTMPRLHARSRLLELGAFLDKLKGQHSPTGDGWERARVCISFTARVTTMLQLINRCKSN